MQNNVVSENSNTPSGAPLSLKDIMNQHGAELVAGKTVFPKSIIEESKQYYPQNKPF